jgi:frataxin
MPPSSLTKLAVRAGRQTIPKRNVSSSLLLCQRLTSAPIINISAAAAIFQSQGLRASRLSNNRSVSTSRPLLKGLSPESEEPSTKEPTTETTEYNVGGVPADLSNERYHELADDYLNSLIEKLEQLQEETEDVDCEYSVCSLSFPPIHPWVSMEIILNINQNVNANSIHAT